MRFKELRKHLHEKSGGYGAETGFSHLRPAVGPFNPDGAIDTPETNLSSLTGESLEKINAYLGAAFCKSYINPSTVLNHIQMKLAEFGLHFDYRFPPSKQGVSPTKTTNSTDDKNGPIDHVAEGEHYYPLTMHGGSYGRYPTDPGFEPYHSDGITRKTGMPLVLCVHVMRNDNSTFTVKPYIKPGSIPTMEETEVEGEQIEEAKGEYLWKALPNGKWAVVIHQGGQKFKTVKIHDKKSDAIKHVNSKSESWGEEVEEASDKKKVSEAITEAVGMKDLGFKPTSQIAGTSLVGYLKGVTLNDLITKFGPPKKVSGKSTVMWAMTNGPLTITIYDYESGGLGGHQKYNFHVGSFYNKYSVKESVRRAFRMMGLAFTATR